MQESVSSKKVGVILGTLGAIGPLAIDMYLPALPQIAVSLGTNEGSVQFSLMAFFTGIMLGQLFYGPFSDRFGRKPIIYIGLLLFIVGSVLCAFSTTVEQFIAWRFVQGLGGSVGLVIGMAVAGLLLWHWTNLQNQD